MRRLLCPILLGLVVMVLLARPAHSQFVVIDPANLVQNTTQAVETVFIAGQTVIMVENQFRELFPLAFFILGGDFAVDMAEIEVIIAEAQGLAYDLASLQAQISALFDLQTAPSSTHEMVLRLTAIRQVVWESRVYAMKTQTLLSTTIRTIQRILGLVGSIASYIGNMSANQTITQVNSTINEQLAKLQVQSAAFERAESVDKLSEPVLQKMLENITLDVSADYPRIR
jgi:conjugal transfer/entry exclusion protein